jgi:hypothetical protein
VCECLRHWSESPYTGHGVNGTIPGSTGWLSSTFQLGPHGLCSIRRRRSKHFPFRRPPAAVTSGTLSENGVWAPGSKQLAVSSDSRPRLRHGGYRWRRPIDELVDLFLLPAIKAGLLKICSASRPGGRRLSAIIGATASKLAGLNSTPVSQ